MLRSLSFLVYILIFSLFYEVVSSFDCYQYSKSEFATIKACPYGCRYEYKTEGSRNIKDSGGCADEHLSPGCRQKGKKSMCMCASDYCNKNGYNMENSSEEH